MNWSMPRVPPGCSPKPLSGHAARVVALQIGERPVAVRDDELVHGRMIEVLADQRELLAPDRPTIARRAASPASGERSQGP